MFALMFKNIFGAKLKLVTGYPGTNDVALAMERGEVDGMCGLSWSTVKTRHLDWVAAKKVNIPVQAGLTKEAEIPDVPVVTEFVKGEEQMQIVRLILASQEMARPFVAPPGIPEDRKRALIEAFLKTMKDPEFLAEAQKMKADGQSGQCRGDRSPAGRRLQDAEGRRRQGREGDHQYAVMPARRTSLLRVRRAFGCSHPKSSPPRASRAGGARRDTSCLR